ncbi:hypothetical protein MTX78_07730 [Hymenobacter tibetensis]|uniref:Cation/H+ exchanger domain-containing protein n=1 Tax=Hymenobacter tibetensis TaxID=497967 RepID=A0ABY4D3I2_9BACT|nr:hypothetical protein [Hymenobacter tibetensis]UOG76479.1 hypothetical protein MTX78_07730 [Hymenobacter tibetensis]
MTTPILFILSGFLIFLGHYLAELLNRTKIPDVVGMLLGSITQLLDPASFGQAGCFPTWCWSLSCLKVGWKYG